MTNYETADFYTDTSLVEDPHSYFDFLRSKGPVTRLPYRNAVAVTGYQETIQVMLDAEHFSSITAVMGPMTKLPFEPEGDDIEAQLEAARPQIDYANQVATENGQRHLNLRSLLSTLFTPTRLKELEARLYRTSDSLIDEFIASGKVDLPNQYGGPYATLIISHLLGIPDEGCQKFRKILQRSGQATFDEIVKAEKIQSADRDRQGILFVRRQAAIDERCTVASGAKATVWRQGCEARHSH